MLCENNITYLVYILVDIDLSMGQQFGMCMCWQDKLGNL